MNVVSIDLNVLCPLLKNMVASNLDSALVVVLEESVTKDGHPYPYEAE